MAILLRRRHYTQRVDALHDVNPHSCWVRTKQFLALPDISDLANLSSSSACELAESINHFLFQCRLIYPLLQKVSVHYYQIYRFDQNLPFFLKTWKPVYCVLIHIKFRVLTLCLHGY